MDEALPSWMVEGSCEPGKENCLSGNPQVHGQGHQPPTENFSEWHNAFFYPVVNLRCRYPQKCPALPSPSVCQPCSGARPAHHSSSGTQSPSLHGSHLLPNVSLTLLSEFGHPPTVTTTVPCTLNVSMIVRLCGFLQVWWVWNLSSGFSLAYSSLLL